MTTRLSSLRTPGWRLIAGLSLLVVVPLTVLARIGWHPLTSFDRRSDNSAHGLVLDHSWLLTTTRSLTHLGDPTVVTLLAIIGAAVMLFTGRRRAAVYLLLARAVAVVVGYALKEGIRRARPVLPHPVAHASGFSFPSGHALGSAALYASVAVVLGSRVPFAIRLAIGFIPPVVVAATRVLLGVHFPSDVIAGLFLGWGIALLLAAAVRP
jgi:membrane-associated phospholipid phosphatase